MCLLYVLFVHPGATLFIRASEAAKLVIADVLPVLELREVGSRMKGYGNLSTLLHRPSLTKYAFQQSLCAGVAGFVIGLAFEGCRREEKVIKKYKTTRHRWRSDGYLQLPVAIRGKQLITTTVTMISQLLSASAKSFWLKADLNASNLGSKEGPERSVPLQKQEVARKDSQAILCQPSQFLSFFSPPESRA